jgi:replicative DNA helicase
MTMSNDDLVNEVIDRLKDEAFLMIADDFIDQLIITLHANVTVINTMTEIAEIENKMQNLSMIPKINRQVETLKNLSKNIAEIAFNVEDVRNEQR